MTNVNYQRLLREGRLNPNDPFQKKKIDALLAAMEIENPEKAEELIALYKEKTDTPKEEPKAEEPKAEKPKKKKGFFKKATPSK